DIVPELIEKIKDYGMEGDLVTNGTLITRERAKLLVGFGWNRIKFSVDGPDPEIHDELRGKEGAFERTIDNIKYISSLREKTHKENPRLYFNTVVSKRNYRKLPEIVRLANKLGVDGIQLLPTTNFSESSHEMQLSFEETEELMDIIDKCIELSQNLGLSENNFSEYSDSKYITDTESMHKVHMEEIEEQFSEDKLDEIINKEYYRADKKESFKYLPCYAPWHHMTIRPNGNIAPCFSPWVWETDVTIKDKSLKEVWYGEVFDRYREIILSGKLPEQCKRCCVWEVFNNKKIRKELSEERSSVPFLR
ncbi:MAG: radical SAM/SPASM domain-containing protein, partial [Candidatus Aenigmatarchaeota archaeon]